MSNDPKSLAEIMKETKDRLRIEQLKERSLPENKTVGICKVCSGEIKEMWKWAQHASGPLTPIGRKTPANKIMSGYSCDDCGILYAKPPKETLK